MNEDPIASVPESASISPATVASETALTSVAHEYLSQTGPWVRLFSVLLFIGAGFMILAGAGLVLAGLVGLSSPREMPGAGAFPSSIGAIVVGPLYLVLSIVLYIVPALFLARYAGAIRTLRLNRSAVALEDAMKHQKSFWRYLGILAIVMLIVSILAIALVLVFVIFMSVRGLPVHN
jgi:hypothetical protein